MREEALLAAVVEWLATVVESEQVGREAPAAHERQPSVEDTLVTPGSEDHRLPLLLGHLRVRRRGGARRGASRNLLSYTRRLEPQAPTGLLCDRGCSVDATWRRRSWVMHGRCGGSEERISDVIAERGSRFRETAQRTSGLRQRT